MDVSLLNFVGLVIGLTMLPGANTMLVIRNSMRGGRRAGFLIIFGGCVAVLVHASLAALQLSAILVISSAVFEIVRQVGACYLIYLGLRALWKAWKSQTWSPDEGVSQRRRALVEGFITNLFSPETTIFYLAAVPQFWQPGEPVFAKTFLLAAIHILVRFAWHGTLTVFVAKIREWLSHRRVQQALESVTGTFLILFGVRLLARR